MTACTTISGGGGDDDTANTGDDAGGDIKQQCIDFYAQCYGISASAAESYCYFIDEYEGLGQCYIDAIDAYLSCIIDQFNCTTHDASTVQSCVDDFVAAINDCPAPDDDTSADDDVDDDTWIFDDTTDDDDADDDVDDDADDDADDDVDDDINAPILSAGGWDPDAFTWVAECGNPDTTTPCTTLTWSVCDVDNDMLPDGIFYIYAAGTSNAFFVGGPGMNVSDFNFPTTPDFSDCGAPIQFGIGLLITEDQFTSGPGDYQLSCDIEATDNAGNLSNKLTDLLLTITYEG